MEIIIAVITTALREISKHEDNQGSFDTTPGLF